MGLIGNVLLSFALLRQRGAQVSLRHNRHMPTSAKLLPHLSLLHHVHVKPTHNLPAYLIKVPAEIFC